MVLTVSGRTAESEERDVLGQWKSADYLLTVGLWPSRRRRQRAKQGRNRESPDHLGTERFDSTHHQSLSSRTKLRERFAAKDVLQWRYFHRALKSDWSTRVGEAIPRRQEEHVPRAGFSALCHRILLGTNEVK